MKALPSLILPFVSFIITLILAVRDQWSAADLAWSIWLAGLLLGLIYLLVYQIAQGDRETLLAYPFFLLFFYFIFAGFLDVIFAFARWDVLGQEMPPLFATVPAAIAHAARERWPFLLTSALSYLPIYVMDARTVHLTDLGKPLFGKDLLRMILLIFILVGLTMLRAGGLALYAVLLIYFTPWHTLRRGIGGRRPARTPASDDESPPGRRRTG
ncbi:MAG: hypothetical protein GXP37_09680 [Chloroflexi bacterium]|nr:hypothetical protein [Chloroflexota bacterium]